MVKHKKLICNNQQTLQNYVQKIFFYKLLKKALRGTPFYLSPELWNILNQRENYGNYNPFATDIYAIGMVILELLLGKNSIFKLTAARL